MGLIEKAKSMFMESEDDEYEEGTSVQGVEEEKVEIKYRGITTFKQVKEVCDCLRKDFPVVINLQLASSDVICRVTDYLSGVLDAIDGEIVAIGVNMWICTPKNVVVEGKYVEQIQQEEEDKGYNKRFPTRLTPSDAPTTQMPTSPYNTKR